MVVFHMLELPEMVCSTGIALIDISIFSLGCGRALKNKSKIGAHIDLDEKTIFHLQTWGVPPTIDFARDILIATRAATRATG
jgi:hypothetical protein